MGTRREREGGLSAPAQKRINSTRSNGLTAKRAHRGVAPRGREGAGEGREKGRGVGEGVRTGEGEGQEEWARWGEEEEKKRRKGQRENGREGTEQDSLRGGVSSTSFPRSTLGTGNLSGSCQTPLPPTPCLHSATEPPGGGAPLCCSHGSPRHLAGT